MLIKSHGKIDGRRAWVVGLLLNGLSALLGVLVGGEGSLLHAAPKTLHVAADAWCPYNCEATSRDRGFMIDMLAEILADKDYQVSYKNVAWTQAMDSVKSGTLDVIVGAGASEAKDLIVPKTPFGVNKTCLFASYTSPLKYTGVASLKTMRVGVIGGYLYGEAIDQYIESQRIHFDRVQIVTGDKPLVQNVKKLQAGRIDVLFENAMVMDFSSRKFGFAGLKNIGCERESPLFVAFSPKLPEAQQIVSYLDQVIPQFRLSGRLEKILNRYGVKDWAVEPSRRGPH
jgi:polar amino acid transport system substrate-binding protein